MAITISLALGSGKAGLTDLRGQLLDDTGTPSGGAISAGFVDVGSGNYLFSGTWDGSFRGAIKFYSAAAPSTVLALAAINPEELGSLVSAYDAAKSAMQASSYTAPDNASVAAIKAKTDNLPSDPADASVVASEITAAVSTLQGSIGAIPAAPSAASVADAVWDEALSGHTATGSAGKLLGTASAAGDPWATEVPGTYTEGTAGAIFGELSQATVYATGSQPPRSEQWRVTVGDDAHFDLILPDSWVAASYESILFTAAIRDQASLVSDILFRIRLDRTPADPPTDGLLVLNGVAALDAAGGRIEIVAPEARRVRIRLTSASTAVLTPTQRVWWAASVTAGDGTVESMIGDRGRIQASVNT